MASTSRTRAKPKPKPQTPPPPSVFKAGNRVEIASDDVGFRGSWYLGKIVKRATTKDANKFIVEYEQLFADEEGKEPLKETLHVHQLRPPAPREKEREFVFGEDVDAYYNDGWWEGTITGVKDGKFSVYFRSSKEQIEFEKEDLRLHREWIDGAWKPPLVGEEDNESVPAKAKTKETPDSDASNTVLGKRKASDTPTIAIVFVKGERVEVTTDEEGLKGAMFAGTIIEPAGEGKYVVEYETLRTDDDKDFLREEVNALQIRPRPPDTVTIDPFNRLDEVDALYNDAWWVGTISKVLSNSKYIVYFRDSCEELQFSHSDLRLHQDWIDGKWVAATQDLKMLFGDSNGGEGQKGKE